MSIGPILVTGGSGQVAQALGALAPARDMEVVVLGRPDVDFDRPESIDAAFASRPWAYVVNAAAYTAVDAAEADEAGAARANADGPELLATLAAKAGIPFIHISTDYVFDGSKGEPYRETDPTNPAGAYGRTKRDGEVQTWMRVAYSTSRSKLGGDTNVEAHIVWTLVANSAGDRAH
jgi:dTDP-4-dehydrorhamnose reductase